MSHPFSLSQLGWKAFYQQQLSLEEWETYTPCRVMAQHRSGLELLSESGPLTLPSNPNMPDLTVGDWILIDANGIFIRVLERLSTFSRKASGSKVSTQLIAANIDTLFIVCSLNHDFNLSRLERYLALAKENQVEAIVVLSKSDCCDDPSLYIKQTQSLDPLMIVEAVNGLDPLSIDALRPWCKGGKTVAFVGSSGVGKSTLVNALLNTSIQDTGSVRGDDSKGRHTTTGRSLHLMESGGLLLDTPGMREIQLADCEQGIEQAFAEILTLADSCQFSNCQHHSEPGCSVKAAIESGDLDERRLNNYFKLMREQAFNSASLAEKRAHYRKQSRFYRSVMSEAKHRKKK